MTCKIIRSTWFSMLSTTQCIGIVIVEGNNDKRAYIGLGNGVDQKEDEQSIIEYGSPFPYNDALKLCENRKSHICEDEE